MIAWVPKRGEVIKQKRPVINMVWFWILAYFNLDFYIGSLLCTSTVLHIHLVHWLPTFWLQHNDYENITAWRRANCDNSENLSLEMINLSPFTALHCTHDLFLSIMTKPCDLILPNPLFEVNQLSQTTNKNLIQFIIQ